MRPSGDDELLGMETRFRALAGEWDLGRTQAAALLGVEPGELGLDLVPRSHTCASEHRLRLLVDIRHLLVRAMREPRDVPVWLRQIDPDAVGGDRRSAVCPLDFMSGPLHHLRAVRGALLAASERR